MAITSRVAAVLRAKAPTPEITPTDGRPVEASSSLVAEFALSGFLGATLVALGAVSVGFIAPSSKLSTAPVIETLRLNRPVAALGQLTVVVGVAILLQAWLRLGHHIRTATVVNPKELLRLLWLWAVPFFMAPVLFSQDIFSYIAASRMLSAGLDPYSDGIMGLPWTNDGADPFWVGSPSPYGPLWVGLSNGIFHLTGAAAIPSLLMFRLLAVAGVALLAIYLPRLAALCGVDAAKVIWLGLLNPLVFIHFISAGHNDALMLGLLVAGLTLALEGRYVTGTLIIVLAGAIKAPALLGLPFVAMAWPAADTTMWRRIFTWVKVSALGLVTFGLLNLMLGLDFGWLSALSTPGQVRTWLSPSTAIGMIGGIIGGLLGHANFDEGSVAFVRAVGSIVSLLLVAVLALACERRTAVRALGLSLLIIVVLGSTVQPWYLLWGLVILTAAGLSANETRIAVTLSAAFTVYSVASSGSTHSTQWHLALNPGLAALLSLLIVGGLLAASSRARGLLLDEQETDHRPVPAPV